MFEAMLDGWRAQQTARYLKPKTIQHNERGVRAFVGHVDRFPWEWRASDVDEYFEDLLSRPQRLARSTLRAYQWRLKGFSEYVCDRRYPWTVICEREFGRAPGQLFDERTWSHAQQLELRDLRQDLLDAWIADGPGIRRRARLFTAWLQRADITGALHVDWPYDFPQRPPLQDEQRLAVLRRLLHDHELGLRERFAGSVLLLYAQPLTRIAQLCTSDITMTDRGETAITFARGANVLPEPLASIALALRCQRVADGEQDGWLLPGRKPGTHITAEHLRKRLAVHGITSRPGRHGALLALAGRLPAPILAERLGIHQARAAQWARAAGATYSGYVELRA